MARTKTEELQLASGTKSPKKKIPVRDPFNFVEMKRNRKSLEGRFQSKLQTAISGTENTEKQIREKLSGPLFQSDKRHRRETVPAVSEVITQRTVIA